VVERLKGGLFLDAGEVKPVGLYQQKIELIWSDTRGPINPPYSLEGATSVVEVDLGEAVEALHLKLRAFTGEELDPIELHPIDGVIEVWIRHFCDLSPPSSPPDSGDGDLDTDFVLNSEPRT
jgi:hypothetical protein